MEFDFLLFLVVGFLAQIIDGALGMAYGVVSTTVLLSFGVAPANASATVHAAELFTTLASAASHAWHRNIDRSLFWRLAPAGAIGGIVVVLTMLLLTVALDTTVAAIGSIAPMPFTTTLIDGVGRQSSGLIGPGDAIVPVVLLEAQG